MALSKHNKKMQAQARGHRLPVSGRRAEIIFYCVVMTAQVEHSRMSSDCTEFVAHS